jgi:hypothetical protein
LSFFGLVPAALIGIDIKALLDRSHAMVEACGNAVGARDNAAVRLGAALAGLSKAGRDKVTLVLSRKLRGLGPWIEQLLSESLGKDGKGLVPVDDEPLGPPAVYGEDRVFVAVALEGDLSHDAALNALEDAGHPVIRIALREPLEVGAEFFRWELATAIACHRMGVNAFDQPDVQRAKEAARKALQRRMGLEHHDTVLHGPSADQGNLHEAAASALAALRDGDAFVVLAFVPQTPAVERTLRTVRRHVRDRMGNATMIGFGPGYLHSTGQLFKGGPDRLVALVLHAQAGGDVGVPGAGTTLGELLHSQALGDVEAMRSLGRRVFFVALDSPRSMSDLTKAVDAITKDPRKTGRGTR